MEKILLNYFFVYFIKTKTNFIGERKKSTVIAIKCTNHYTPGAGCLIKQNLTTCKSFNVKYCVMYQ